LFLSWSLIDHWAVEGVGYIGLNLWIGYIVVVEQFTLVPKLIVDRSLSCGRCRLHVYLIVKLFGMLIKYPMIGFQFILARYWICHLMIVVLGYSWHELQQVWSNDTTLLIMVRILNHTQTYTVWYSLLILIGPALIETSMIMSYLFINLFCYSYSYWVDIDCAIIDYATNDWGSYFYWDNNSCVLFINGFCYLYSCQAEVWTMLEELNYFAKFLLMHLLFLNMNCLYFWTCLLFTSILTSMNRYT
jgi:hypothetical protein